MSRFTEFKYDEKQWELRVEEKLDKHYDDDVGHIKKYYFYATCRLTKNIIY